MRPLATELFHKIKHLFNKRLSQPFIINTIRDTFSDEEIIDILEVDEEIVYQEVVNAIEHTIDTHITHFLKEEFDGYYVRVLDHWVLMKLVELLVEEGFVFLTHYTTDAQSIIETIYAANILSPTAEPYAVYFDINFYSKEFELINLSEDYYYKEINFGEDLQDKPPIKYFTSNYIYRLADLEYEYRRMYNFVGIKKKSLWDEFLGDE